MYLFIYNAHALTVAACARPAARVTREACAVPACILSSQPLFKIFQMILKYAGNLNKIFCMEYMISKNIL